tara:strand:+ start:673 stop:1527 length:855 start_codon:yes stop_codon:yes gene_type:complete
MKISVVIPTLGGPSLIKLIKSLEKSYMLPNEVVCVISKKNNFTPPFSRKIKIKIIFTNFQNQVLQRIEGIKNAKHDLILQTDDDVIFDKYSLMHLYNALKKRNINTTIIGPVFFTRKKELHYDYTKENFFTELIKFTFCAAPLGKNKLGKVTSLGLAFNINYSNKLYLYPSQWLPGGCIFYHKKNSILKFPIKYKGKSYSEDIIHSILRRKKNLHHFVVRNSKIITDKVSYNNFSIKQILNEFVVRKSLLNYTKGNTFRFYIWCIFEIVNRIFRKLIFNKNKII